MDQNIADLFNQSSGFGGLGGLGGLPYKGWRESENVTRGKPLIGADYLMGEIEGGPLERWQKLHPMDYPPQAQWGLGNWTPPQAPQPNIAQQMRQAPFSDEIARLLGWQSNQ